MMARKRITTPVPGATPRYDDDGYEIVEIATCGTCGRSWNDAAVSSVTPAPSGRCPFEYEHDVAHAVHGYEVKEGDNLPAVGTVLRVLDSQTTMSGKTFILVEFDSDKLFALEAERTYEVQRPSYANRRTSECLACGRKVLAITHGPCPSHLLIGDDGFPCGGTALVEEDGG